MTIRNATQADLPVIESIYADARAYMRAHGNLSQWSGGYPSRELLLADLSQNQLYVVEDEAIIGVFVYFFGNDPTYDVIEGAWLNDRPYGVIHRIAVGAHRKGVASFVFEHCLALCHNLKIDTHADNIPMQKSLLKNGFTHTGIIHLADGAPREAFQKTTL
ncbi:MAG: N-acetyltransferase [Ruminococcaceae bacterium]|nr:N-acetyltransferase [Oscillospiraceae bacterium]